MHLLLQQADASDNDVRDTYLKLWGNNRKLLHTLTESVGIYRYL